MIYIFQIKEQNYSGNAKTPKAILVLVKKCDSNFNVRHIQIIKYKNYF